MTLISKEEDFLATKEAYKDRHLADYTLAVDLQLCREYYGKSGDWYPTTSAQKALFTRYLNHYMRDDVVQKTTSQENRDSLMNLYQTMYGVYHPEVLENRLDMIATIFRSIVDQLQRNDHTAKSRQEIITSLDTKKSSGFNRIMKEVFNRLEKVTVEGQVKAGIEEAKKQGKEITPELEASIRATAEARQTEIQKVLDNKGRLMAMAAPRIGEMEGFKIDVKNLEITAEQFDAIDDIDSEDAGKNENDDPDNSKGDRYTDYRVLKLMSTLSINAKQIISRIPRVNDNGEVMRDDLGFVKYLDPRQAAYTLLEVLTQSSPETMMDDLQDAQVSYPWIRGLVDRLTKNPQDKTAIYDNFHKAATTYVYASLENGKYVLHTANTMAQGQSLRRRAGNNMTSGFILDSSHSVYDSNGNLKSAEELKTLRDRIVALNKYFSTGVTTAAFINMTLKGEQRKAYRERYGNMDPVDAMRLVLDTNKDEISEVVQFARGLGFPITEEQFKTAALQQFSMRSGMYLFGSRIEHEWDVRNKLIYLVASLASAYSRAYDIAASNRGDKTGLALYNSCDALGDFHRLMSAAIYDELEARVLEGGKTYATYNNYNRLHEIFDSLGNKDGRSTEKYIQDLENDFTRYEGMSRTDEDGNFVVRGWLKHAVEKGAQGGQFRVLNASNFNHVEYAQLNRAQKLTMSLMMFRGQGRVTSGAYEVPIQSDYSTAYDFVEGPKYDITSNKQDGALFDVNDIHAPIVEEVAFEVLTEIDRINAIKARQNDKNRAVAKVYEEQGSKFQIFPELNENGFMERYASISDPDEAYEMVCSEVAHQLQQVLEQDIKTINESGMLKNKNVGQNSQYEIGFYVEDGLVSSLSASAQEEIQKWCLNTFFARQQICKLTTGGLHEFNGLLDYEKRNMLTHATRTSLNTEAYWGKEKVGKETQRVAYIGDDVSRAATYEDIVSLLAILKEEGKISAQQYDTMKKAYGRIKTTDGMGLRDLDSYRSVRIMADTWDKKHEAAYSRIKLGKYTSRDVDLFMEDIKPVFTGDEVLPAASGEDQRPVKLTVLHKYSEALLLPIELAKYCIQAQSVPLRALQMTNDELGPNDKVDLWLFHSGCKVGAHTVLRPFAKTDSGERRLKSVEAIKRYLTIQIKNNPFAVHTLPFKNYGIAASTIAHVEDEISPASQMEKIVMANIVSGDEIECGGKKCDAAQMRDLYSGIKSVDIIEQYQKLVDYFQDADKLESLFQREIASKPYASDELSFAFARLKTGDFAVPLFSPNVVHQVEQMLTSILRDRVQKHQMKGANILQATGVGMDAEQEIAQFAEEEGAIKNDDKLSVVFEGTGKNRHVKYAEVFIPIHDGRLRRFADKTGVISPARLRTLVEEGIIDEKLLEFVAYRTPSDAEHSVIPCRVKGFIAGTGGANIYMPKEIMVMTGHDYDGDKMRCHFRDFHLEDINGEVKDEDAVAVILGQKKLNDVFPLKAVADTYDYEKQPWENSQKARDNARVDIIFGMLTSPQGSRRMLIPGGCDESKVYAKSLYLTSSSTTESEKARLAQAIVDALKRKQKEGESDEAYKRYLDDFRADEQEAVSDVLSCYEHLSKMSDSDLSKILDKFNGSQSPFSLTHSADAHEYIMGGAEMIGIYALYNSAFQMFQRLNLRYVPRVDKKGRALEVILFGQKIGSLFNVTDKDGRLTSLALARLLNAAVDNNKDPILGYLNQTKEMAEMTFFLLAAGVKEEQLHLIMNQPAVIELMHRMKDAKGEEKGLGKIAMQLVDEMNNRLNGTAEVKTWKNLEHVAAMPEEKFIKNLRKTYDGIMSVEGVEMASELQPQIDVLQTLIHLNNAASNLAKFVRLTRPESKSGGVGTTMGSVIAKNMELNEFREKLIAPDSAQKMQISGMAEVLARRDDVGEGQDISWFAQQMGGKMQDVVAANTCMKDLSLELFVRYFPQMREDWRRVIKNIADRYDYSRIQDGVIQRIANEMILWKLLQSTSAGSVTEERERLIKTVPERLAKLKDRISKIDSSRIWDPSYKPADMTAARLSTNTFIQKLGITAPNENVGIPRIMFRAGGPVVDKSADKYRIEWNALITDQDAEVRELGYDLFKYNLYTNGFAYGMYEFGHFAPFSLLMTMDKGKYMQTLREITTAGFFESDIDNFVNQYYMNHWDDEHLVPRFWLDELPDGLFKGEGISSDQLTGKNARILEEPYFVAATVGTDEKGKKQYSASFFRVSTSENGMVRAILAEKLGIKNRRGQSLLQYNPQADYRTMKRDVSGDINIWGVENVTEEEAYAFVNVDKVSKETMRESAPIQSVGPISKQKGYNQFSWFEKHLGLTPASTPAVKAAQSASDSAVEASNKNNEELSKIPAPTSEEPQQISEEEMLAISAASNMFGVEADMDLLRQAKVAAKGELYIPTYDAKQEKYVLEKYPASPEAIAIARKVDAYARLNQRLTEILREKGVDVGVLTEFEARLGIGGVTDFDTAKVTLEGLKEMIRVANGLEGVYALPEEFAHLAIEMLGHDHPLVARLLHVLSTNDNALREAFGEQYDDYMTAYQSNREKMIVEAAGKLVAKQLFEHRDIETKEAKSLVRRIIDAIKEFLRKFDLRRLIDAGHDAERIASQLARNLLGGQILDDMSLENVSKSGQFLNIQKNLSDKADVQSKLLRNEVKRLDVLEKRFGYYKENEKAKAILDATRQQITMLENSIENNKSELAIVEYMANSLKFLADAETDLDTVVSGGYNANIVCKNLNAVRDTLYSFSSSLKAIDQAIQDGEIRDSVGINKSKDEVEKVLSRLYQKYNRIAMHYFQDTLANFYGQDGIEITIGRDRGKKVTIDEMARMAGGDISFMSRWFNSLADCNDYVLKAIDGITRKAKWEALRRSQEVKPQIEAAVAKLIRDTGSRDTSFMFAKQRWSPDDPNEPREDDGKLHKTGYYISKDSVEYKNLTKPQQEFYDTMMAIKREADLELPQSLVSENKIVMLRKYTLDRIRGKETAGEIKDELVNGIKASMMEMGDVDFEHENVVKDFEGNKVDSLPVKFVMKGKNETYDDMTDDVAMSMMAYASMAFEYGALNSVIGELENAKFMASQRDVIQKKGIRTQRENVSVTAGNTDYGYQEPFTVKQIHTHIQDVLEDFFQMHLYGHINKDEGTFGRTRLSKRKMVNMLNGIVSFSQMALNIPQRLANVSTGFSQIAVETAGGGVFNASDVAWASKIWMMQSAGERLAETGKTDCKNKLSLWAEYFDIHQDNGRAFKSTSYSKKRLSRIFNTNLLYAGLTIGEDFLGLTTSLAAARNFKVKNAQGKEETLWDAYEVKYVDKQHQTGAYLGLKDGYTKLDGSPITKEDEEAFANKVIGMNFDLQGIYNLNDRSAIQQHWFGALIIMYRKWIAPALKRRYGSTQYSTLKGEFEEGYHRTMFNYLWDSTVETVRAKREEREFATPEEAETFLERLFEDVKAILNSLTVNWNNLSDYEKGNMRRSLTELGLVIGLFAACWAMAMVPPDEDKTKLGWTTKLLYSNLLRLRMELGSQAPTPMFVNESLKMLNSPFAAVGVVKDTLNIFQLMLPTNYLTEVKSGRYRGHTKAYKYFRELPIISMWKKLDNFVDPTPMINYYKNDTRF
jgi:hypothetical protein